MNLIIEIDTPEKRPEALQYRPFALITPFEAARSAAKSRSDDDQFANVPQFVRFDGDAKLFIGDGFIHDRLAEDETVLPTGIAINVSSAQLDLDQISSQLRAVETRLGVQDRRTRIIAFPFPDLATLADHPHGLIPSPRMFGLALDEVALTAALPATGTQKSSPALYARARLVAAARNVACPSFLRPEWTHDAASNRHIIDHAKADGFDGVIVPIRYMAAINID